eukprot:CAMPEP_0117657336 /NCGR_PEP_ID=MMETSP0804-20121206/5276_1 /TAXON_ID=1074897 /ORGANISM="Tetraselmis astigmatica, Strain CCMP880" /LENGTH=161 /DNA_ID=CAMNT_0005463783 /DNA_START=61 /DNA_END=543 /DNA_ORIENTATION=+
MTPVPRLVAFDLDGTLWWPEMYMLSGPPFKARLDQGRVIDRSNEAVYLMGASRSILNEMAVDPKWSNTSVAYVSRTTEPAWAKACLKLFQVHDAVSMDVLGKHQQIYPGNKKKHFNLIHSESGIPFEDMVFFDNEMRNCRDVAELGVICVYTPDGMTEEVW